MAAERSVVTSATIPAPPQAVWEILADTTRYAEWVEATTEVVRSDGPGVVGATYEERNVLFGPVKGSSRWRVVEADAPRRTVHVGEGIWLARDVRLTWELTPVADSATEFTMTVHYRPAFGPLGSLIDSLGAGRSVEAAQRRTTDNLTRLVEREARAAPA